MADETREPDGGADPEAPERPRRGQIASERSVYETGRQGRVLADALGGPPPGYGLTFVRGYVIGPTTVVAVWDVNDPRLCRDAEVTGWKDVAIRVVDAAAGGAARTVPVAARSGTFRIDLPSSYRTISLELFLDRGAGERTLARSSTIRVPPSRESTSGEAAPYVAVPAGVDLRRLLGAEPPPPCGQRFRPHGTAERLRHRLRHAASRPLAPPDGGTGGGGASFGAQQENHSRGSARRARRDAAGSDGSADDDRDERRSVEPGRGDSPNLAEEASGRHVDDAASLAWELLRDENPAGPTSASTEAGVADDPPPAHGDSGIDVRSRSTDSGGGPSRARVWRQEAGATSPVAGFSLPTSPVGGFSSRPGESSRESGEGIDE